MNLKSKNKNQLHGKLFLFWEESLKELLFQELASGNKIVELDDWHDWKTEYNCKKEQ